jgi:hypothetical protein
MEAWLSSFALEYALQVEKVHWKRSRGKFVRRDAMNQIGYK